MNKFLQILIASFLAYSLISCKREKFEVGSGVPAWFLFSNQLTFNGKIADSTVLWRYGVFEFQSSQGVINVGSIDQPRKYLTFSLTSNADLTTRFEINTPTFKSDTAALFADILSVGSKNVGSQSEKFEMKLTLNNITYSTRGDQTSSSLQIIKVEKTKDEFERDLALVWFKTNCKFYRPDNSFAFDVIDGYILAGFLYNL
jgi:hypothetical protein